MHKPKLVGQLPSALDHLPCLCEVIEIPSAHSALFLWWKSLTLHVAAPVILTVYAFCLVEEPMSTSVLPLRGW